MLQNRAFLCLARRGYVDNDFYPLFAYKVLTKLFFCRCAKYSTNVELTRVRYPNVKRGRFGTITDNDLNYFESLLGANRVITDSTELEGYFFKNLTP